MEKRTLFIAALAALFLLTSIGLGILSVHVYDTIRLNDTRQELSDASEYFTRQIRESDGNYIRTAALGGDTPALVMESYREGVTYETWFFTYEDHLKKVTAKKDEAVLPESGETVLPLAHADFALLREDLLEIRLTSTNGTSYILNFHIYNFEGGGQ